MLTSSMLSNHEMLTSSKLLTDLTKNQTDLSSSNACVSPTTQIRDADVIRSATKFHQNSSHTYSLQYWYEMKELFKRFPTLPQTRKTVAEINGKLPEKLTMNSNPRV
ncbi:hypothetical protein F511_46634 [Dorcoceras hygrometricum]|uniref:Uncharacterized protein n=1 Tax=Dorcoceras hygrometricum TaxID=472368 RepID=A0A2Z6ZU29_9LAMI|nr:hypothetical protein F511_46634 [Dorcoceras hygrometricum]